MMSAEPRPTLSIVMPCLNEARTVGTCIKKAQLFLQRARISGEIILADNGSSDGSQELATRLGARVVAVPRRGYGNALRAGIAAARGEYVIMGDSDDSYDFSALDPFVEKLREGYDLVLGNRFAGGIKKGAMPPLHRYFGNPVLTFLGRLLYRSPSRDFYCGLRGFRRDTISALGLSADGMEFALEMIVKATIQKLRITEVPTTLSPDGRDRPPHLRSWRDGWRSLRFFLLLCPRAVFLYPGIALFVTSGTLFIALLFGDVRIGIVKLSDRALIASSFGTLVGFQSILLWAFGEMIAIDRGLFPKNPTFERALRALSLERGLIVGGLIMAIGIVAVGGATFWWSLTGFGPIEGRSLIGLVCGSSAMVALGFQCISGSFFSYLLQEARIRTASSESPSAVKILPSETKEPAVAST
jgi:glycosyltransferase involved in cell wall biosynthesis